MTDNPTRAKMAILNLTPDEIIEAIKLLPGPSDWRCMVVGSEGGSELTDALYAINQAVLDRGGLVPMSGALDTYAAAFSYKCTPAQARDIALSVYSDQWGVTQHIARKKLKKAYGDRPHNPETMELIFDDNEIP
jgi:hypothetical protein